jgi:hypothetical protein
MVMEAPRLLVHPTDPPVLRMHDGLTLSERFSPDKKKFREQIPIGGKTQNFDQNMIEACRAGRF